MKGHKPPQYFNRAMLRAWKVGREGEKRGARGVSKWISGMLRSSFA